VSFGSAAPARAVFLDAGNDALRVLGLAEGYQHLIQHDVVQHFVARFSKALCEQLRRATAHNEVKPRPIAPNAPSTWTQAPVSRVRSQICLAGSKAPVLTLPAWMQTSVRSLSVGSASAACGPDYPSARITRVRPNQLLRRWQPCAHSRRPG
jgi:hypothetical protein